MTMRLGLRNLSRRPGRTILTAAMLFFGTALLVFAVGLSEGTYSDMIRVATGTWSGHIQIVHEGYPDSPALYETLDQPQALIDRFEAEPQVEAATARLEIAGLLSAGERTAGAMLTGVMPEREPKVSTLPRTLEQGTFLEPIEGDPEALPIVLGQGLARRLRVGLGDEIVYMGQAADGSIAAELYVVGGILGSSMGELDARLAMIRLEDAQALAELPGRAHRVVARVARIEDVEALDARVQVEVPAQVTAWYELTPELRNSIEADRAGGTIFFAIIIVMIALGVVNTMVMAVFERTREFGVMKALGTGPGRIIAMVLWESFWIALIGVGLGLVAGTALNAWLADVGIQFYEEAIEFGGTEISRVYPANTVLANVVYPLVIFGAALVGGLWPAIRAARIEPVDAIREV